MMFLWDYKKQPKRRHCLYGLKSPGRPPNLPESAAFQRERQKALHRAWKQRNRDKVRAADRAYRAKHGDRIRQRHTSAVSERYWQRVAAGRCVTCPAPVSKYRFCRTCREKRAARARAYYQKTLALKRREVRLQLAEQAQAILQRLTDAQQALLRRYFRRVAA